MTKKVTNCVCEHCGRKYIWERKRGHTKKQCNSCCVNHKRFKVKHKIIEFLGGKCKNCGYNKCVKALHAHHLDPNEKEFNLSGAHSRSWARIEAELLKCILLCANCHAEEHSKARIPSVL